MKYEWVTTDTLQFLQGQFHLCQFGEKRRFPNRLHAILYILSILVHGVVETKMKDEKRHSTQMSFHEKVCLCIPGMGRL